MLLSTHVTNSFALTTGFYWSYTLLLKLPVLMRSWHDNACVLKNFFFTLVWQVELLKRTKNWQGLLRIGLTTCNPSSFSVIPQVSTQLPQETWIVNGCSVLANGNTVTENYGRSLDRLQVRISLKLKLFYTWSFKSGSGVLAKVMFIVTWAGSLSGPGA